MKTEFSRDELYSMGMPFGDSATRMKPGGRGRIYGSGGGGGGGVKYDNLERLYEIQASQAQSLMEQANQNVYPTYNELVQEAKNTGSQANQEEAAANAAADVASSRGQAKKNLEENLASMGVNPSDPRYANTMASMELESAAAGAGAQNAARNRVKDLGYARRTDVVNSGLGIGSNAVAALNSAGGMATSIANGQLQQQANSSAAQANMAMLGTRLLGFKAGGLVPKPCYAGGGIVGAAMSMTPPPPPVTANRAPSASPLRSVGTDVALGGSGRLGKGIENIGDMLGSNQISSFGKGMRLGKDAQPAIDAYKGAAETAKGATDIAASNASNAAAYANELDAASSLASGVEGAVAPGAAEAAAAATGAETAAAGSAAAGTAAELGVTAGAMEAGAGLATTLGVAMPWIGGAMLAGSLLGLFADGGQVPSKIGGKSDASGKANNKAGGHVDGPGGPKDDQIDARLSPGEFVMPVGSVQLYGLNKLEQMRARGLQYEKQTGIA